MPPWSSLLPVSHRFDESEHRGQPCSGPVASAPNHLTQRSRRPGRGRGNRRHQSCHNGERPDRLLPDMKAQHAADGRAALRRQFQPRMLPFFLVEPLSRRFKSSTSLPTLPRYSRIESNSMFQNALLHSAGEMPKSRQIAATVRPTGLRRTSAAMASMLGRVSSVSGSFRARRRASRFPGRDGGSLGGGRLLRR